MQVMGTGGCGTAVAAITRGIPGCLGGGVNGVYRFRVGGCSSDWALCPSEGRCVHRLPRPGEGAGVQWGREQRCATRGHAGAAARPWEGLGGGHIT